MEHRINIEETTYPNIVQRIDKNVLELPPLLSEYYCIYKVHERLCKVKLEAYKPMLVSIGPYHHRNHKLDAMKTHKMRYLRSLLERKREESVKRYFLELVKLEDRARKCYANPIDLMGDEFVEMMLLDGCFIIEYFHKIISRFENNDDDPILVADWMKSRICLDMMLLENQLPYFVLSKLYDMTRDSEERTFRQTAILVFKYLLLKPHANFIYDGENNTEEIKHLLHLVYILCAPSSKERITENRPFLEGRIGNKILYQMHSAVEFSEAEVRFMRDGEVRLFDIKFDNGLMTIPCFNVEDSTYTFFLNLIAYEQHSLDVKCKYFTDYASFMGQKFLHLRGIIVNMLGDDKEVSQLFNDLRERVINSSSFYYFAVCNQVNGHFGKPFNLWMATLKRDYFNKPWTTILVMQAVVILLLTVVQTITTVLQVNFK